MQSREQHQASILLVDDNPANISFLFEYLDKLGFKVLVGEDGYDALRLAKEYLPDIILLDVLMPEMNGLETCLRLKEQKETEDIPIIFMTALSGVDDIVRGFEVGGVDYITKPFQQKAVLARIHAHLTLRRQRMLLAELNSMKDTFFSIIAHDMRHALVPLIGLSNLLSDEQFDRENVPEVAKKIDGYVQQAHHLLENLLYWADIRFGKINFQPKVIDLHDISLEVRNLLRGHARQKQISLDDNIETPTLVYVDQNMTSTIFRNLISNGIKFTPQGGKVAISAQILEDTVVVTISDTGVGISETNQQKLFRIDQKFLTVGTGGEIGSGLGLIICRDLVEKQQGTIMLQSQAGEGTICTFTLPKAENQKKHHEIF
ncbi:response regulator receiver sensor signal transduction histidine kinase [Candidatus Vecturithrix granuli]|uniref:histidine kinase n=1 Tax=Vecturithrix granuli TaxID=1499967 RepID=A0A081C9A6_VECG1|nr:response regulator receiver sensor signal transduction histidine kinase [Candidatus Vecturithrix granuli]